MDSRKSRIHLCQDNFSVERIKSVNDRTFFDFTTLRHSRFLAKTRHKRILNAARQLFFEFIRFFFLSLLFQQEKLQYFLITQRKRVISRTTTCCYNGLFVVNARNILDSILEGINVRASMTNTVAG